MIINLRAKLDLTLTSLNVPGLQISPFNLILQPIPFTADTLLGSFYKLPDGSILVGGKEATSCGINPYSGKVTAIKCLIKFVLMSLFRLEYPNTQALMKRRVIN